MSVPRGVLDTSVFIAAESVRRLDEDALLDLTGSELGVNDLWIAATAVAHGLPVISQDADVDSLLGAEGFTLVRV